VTLLLFCRLPDEVLQEMAAKPPPLSRIGCRRRPRSRNLEDRSADRARGRAKLSLELRSKMNFKRRLEGHGRAKTSSSCKLRPLGSVQAVAVVGLATTSTGRRVATANVLASDVADVVPAVTASGRSSINLVLGVILPAATGAIEEATLSTMLAGAAAGRPR
jgi:hypothetical protein